MYKVVLRKFTALNYPKGSVERNRLNKSSLTSEFARHKRWLVTENNKPLLSFETPNECYNFINDPNKNKYKPRNRIRKYTRKMMLNTQNFFSQKRRFLKNSM